MQTLSTSQGDVQLMPPTPEIIRNLRSHLPFGLLTPSEAGEPYGIVMQCGQTELLAVKQQPPDTNEQIAMQVYQHNMILIAHALKCYSEHGFNGLLIPCGYVRMKENGRVESGIASFGFPAKEGRETLGNILGVETAYDSQLGDGFTKMLVSFIHALKKSSQETGLSQTPVIGLDVRSRLQLGKLGFGFAVMDSRIICLKTQILKNDPVWTALRASGVEQVFHLPSVPAAIKRELLAQAKEMDTITPLPNPHSKARA